MPGLSTSPGGGIDSTNRLRTPPPRITSNNTSNDIQFDQRLQAIRRSALEQKKLVQNSLYGAIEYDQPPEAPSNNTDTPKLVGLGTKIGLGVAVVIFGFVFVLGDFLPTSRYASDSMQTAHQKGQSFVLTCFSSKRNQNIAQKLD